MKATFKVPISMLKGNPLLFVIFTCLSGVNAEGSDPLGEMSPEDLQLLTQQIKGLKDFMKLDQFAADDFGLMKDMEQGYLKEIGFRGPTTEEEVDFPGKPDNYVHRTKYLNKILPLSRAYGLATQLQYTAEYRKEALYDYLEARDSPKLSEKYIQDLIHQLMNNIGEYENYFLLYFGDDATEVQRRYYSGAQEIFQLHVSDEERKQLLIKMAKNLKSAYTD